MSALVEKIVYLALGILFSDEYRLPCSLIDKYGPESTCSCGLWSE